MGLQYDESAANRSKPRERLRGGARSLRRGRLRLSLTGWRGGWGSLLTTSLKKG